MTCILIEFSITLQDENEKNKLSPLNSVEHLTDNEEESNETKKLKIKEKIS